MLKALILSIRQLFDPAISRVLVRCVLLALATFALLVAAVGLGLGALDPTGLALLDGTLAVLGSLGAVVLAFVLWPTGSETPSEGRSTPSSMLRARLRSRI